MISEDWSNDAEKQLCICNTGINYILQCIQTETVVKNRDNVSQYYWYYCIFDQINVAVVSKRASIKNHPKITQTFER